MSAPLHVVRAGQGPRCVLVHGSATEHATWTIQFASRLTAEVRLIAYDRRGAGRSPLPDGVPWLTVEEHARDLAGLIDAEGGPAVVVGSSFGGVVALELTRRWPALVRGAVLLEPPLPPSDDQPSSPPGFLEGLDATAAEHGAPAAAERFLRTVLGDDAWGKLPRAFQERSKGFWPQIRGDCHALAAYQVRYAELAAIDVPMLLLGGERSAAYFRPTLEALARSLGRARLDVLKGAGHMMQAEAPRGFHDRLTRFLAELPSP